MSTVVQAYQFALDPTVLQESGLRSHCGAQRTAFNWGLALITANLAQRAAERSYGIGDEQLTPSVNWSAYSLRKIWNQVKGRVAPWWAENSKEAYASGLANLATALGNWADSRAGTLGSLLANARLNTLRRASAATPLAVTRSPATAAASSPASSSRRRRSSM